MIKLRQAYYCNLKILLLYLVVYGHWIEPAIGTSELLLVQYRLIYLIHMPLFAFLSGLFLQNQGDCLRQFKRLLPLYGALQLAAFFLTCGTMDLWTPWWHLWYLLSYCVWSALGWMWFRFSRKKGNLLILAASVLIGALAGFIPWLDRTFSGSRTAAFFPFFWAGLICSPKLRWNKYRRWGISALIVSFVMFALWGNRIPVTLLYHAAPYEAHDDVWLRLLCYLLSSLLGFFFLTAIPAKRLPYTKAGSNTMPGYLIHAPVVGVLREIHLPWGVCVVLSALLLCTIYKILQWNSTLYGIVPANKGGTDIWPSSRKFTSNMANRCIDTFCP